MRNAILSLGLFAACLIADRTIAFACGDKLLAFARGVRFQRTAKHRASVILYRPFDSKIPRGVTDPQVQSYLRKAGHSLYTVDDLGRLSQALQNGNYDVVIGELTNAEVLEREAHSSPSKPLFMPAIFKPTRAQAAEADKQYRCFLRADAEIADYIGAIDKAMALKLKLSQDKAASGST
jgi:hypothetical protein